MFRPWAARTAVIAPAGKPRWYVRRRGVIFEPTPDKVVVRLWEKDIHGYGYSSLAYSCPYDFGGTPPVGEKELTRTYYDDPPNMYRFSFRRPDDTLYLHCLNPLDPTPEEFGIPPFLWELASSDFGFLMHFYVRGESELWPPMAAKPCELFDAMAYYDEDGQLRVYKQYVSATISLA